MLDEALTRRLARVAPLNVQQLCGLAALRSRPDCDIAEVTHQVGWSGKHFKARVQDSRVSPRCYRRLMQCHRLSRAVQGAPNWAKLALDIGYCHQPHLFARSAALRLTPTWRGGARARTRSISRGGAQILSLITPGFRYTDAVTAIDFQRNAFGFQRHAVFADDADLCMIYHAQLTHSDGMIMLGSARPDDAARLEAPVGNLRQRGVDLRLRP